MADESSDVAAELAPKTPPGSPPPADSTGGGDTTSGGHLRESRAEQIAFAWGWLVPLALLAAIAVWVEHQSGVEGLSELGRDALLSLFVIGKFVIFLGLRDDAPLDPAGLGVVVWLVDVFWAFVVVGGLSRVESLPFLGRQLQRARHRAREVLDEYPRLESMAFWGVALLVFLPLAATGAVTGSFAAQLVGLRRFVGVAAVAMGSALTGAFFVGFARLLGERAEDILRSPVLAGASVALLLVLGRVAYVRVRRVLRG